MTLEDQLKNEILGRYKSIRAFTTSINIPYSTLDSVFKRGIANAGVSTMIKVFGTLDLDIESIASGKLQKKTTPEDGGGLDETELRLVALHRGLNCDGQEILLGYANYLNSNDKYIKSHSPGLGKEA